MSSERLRMLMVNAYLVDGSLGSTISVHTNRTDEVILIHGTHQVLTIVLFLSLGVCVCVCVCVCACVRVCVRACVRACMYTRE